MTTQIIADNQTILEYEESPADPNHRAHIVSPPENLHIFEPGMEAQDIVDIARATRQHVVALCGHVWVPSRDPEKYDACEPCIKIAGFIMRSLGE